MNHEELNRQEAIDEIFASPNPKLAVMAIPVMFEEKMTRVWITADFAKTPQKVISSILANSAFDVGTKEDTYDCAHCGKLVMVFESICPNCGALPYSEDDENA